ncbi:hypothetical protein [Phocaeicola coprophilus]|uniref:Uncharacterized protein n=1 Tax=Phocaeicola coprophilus TaxID=387090 RepID=A0A413T5A8_9BACT|nr:hypothetical protein [Phocaeicola coprophilus]RHA79012.1 hypothetical protein DW921_00700 [Phocaeicola coprophilus]
MSENKKSMILRAFTISNSNIKTSESDIMEKLEMKLHDSVAYDRIMPLRNEKDSPEDLLSDYTINPGKYIFGVMFRLIPTKEVNNIPDDLFTHSKIQIDEIRSKEAKTGLTCKEHFYFAINNSHLVTNLPGNKTIKSLQTYLNWLTEALRGDTFYDFNPKVSSEKIKLSNLQKIIVSDPNAKQKISSHKGEASNKVIKLAKDLISNLLETASDLEQIIEKNILSAKLVVSFSKPKSMSEDDYKRELSAFLKPVSDAENIEFKTPKGQIKGTDLLLSEIADIDLLEDGSLNEKTILMAMTNYLVKLKNM